MKPSSIDKLPCAGQGVDEGCGIFEHYVDNETQYIRSHLGTDSRAKLIDDQGVLRDKLFEDFIEAGHCVLARERSDQLPDGVIPLFGERDISFAGCRVAIKERETR